MDKIEKISLLILIILGVIVFTSAMIKIVNHERMLLEVGIYLILVVATISWLYLRRKHGWDNYI